MIIMNKILEKDKELFAKGVKKVMSLVNHEGSNVEKINAIKELIEK
jgi:hypothetical protein